MDYEMLVEAYARGIFPWFEKNGRFYWFSPNPRMVLFIDDFRYSKSLRRVVKSHRFEVRVDTCFADVIQHCAMVARYTEEGETGTWITPNFQQCYCDLHRRGLAHSFETFYEGKLVGGLYGVSLGSMFFGESMFHTMTDASKVAFVRMVEFCRLHGFTLIDAQMQTKHLASLGAAPIARDTFLDLVEHMDLSKTMKYSWNRSTAILLLGCNENSRLLALTLAMDEIEKRIGRISHQSHFYESEPWGFDAATPFLNNAIAVETTLSPSELLHAIKEIEQMMGRDTSHSTNWRDPQRTYTSRPIDIDIILYDNEVVDTPELCVPHPRMHLRRFALMPLCDICPNVEHPVLKRSIKQLLDECSDTSSVELYLDGNWEIDYENSYHPQYDDDEDYYNDDYEDEEPHDIVPIIRKTKRKDVRITAIRKADYADLQERYENKIEHACCVTEGQQWIAREGRCPEGFCGSAWQTLQPFVEQLATGGGDFYDGWMRDPHSAMLSCNDGFRPVSFLIEAIEPPTDDNDK